MHGDEVAIPVLFILSCFGIFIAYIVTRHKERQSVISKGLNSDEIKALYSRAPRPGHPLTSLKWGLLFIFGGLAVLVGNFLHERYMVDGSVIVGMVCLFAGIALMIFYGIASKKTDRM